MYTLFKTGKFPTFIVRVHNTAKFCRKKNLTSHQEILIRERKFDGLSFKGSLVAEIWAPELLTLMLTLPPMENELVDYTHIGYCQNNFQKHYIVIRCYSWFLQHKLFFKGQQPDVIWFSHNENIPSINKTQGTYGSHLDLVKICHFGWKIT